jgi:transcriptional regulator with XRE-family HTH domain
MFFEFRNRNRTIKELRKDQSYTAQQLADKSGVAKIEILRIDNLKLREIKQPIRSMLLPTLHGDDLDGIH